jgi:hypothetical protein
MNESQRKAEVREITLCTRCVIDFKSNGYLLVQKGLPGHTGECNNCLARTGIRYGVFDTMKPPLL